MPQSTTSAAPRPLERADAVVGTVAQLSRHVYNRAPRPNRRRPHDPHPLAALLLLLSGARVARAQHADDAAGGDARADREPRRRPPRPRPPRPRRGRARSCPAGELAEEAPRAARRRSAYGMRLGLRWITVPSWMLNLFTKKNVPLSSWGTGVAVLPAQGELRSGRFVQLQEHVAARRKLAGQGRTTPRSTPTTSSSGAWRCRALDISFIWHTMFTDWFGMHYGAGIGVGIVARRHPPHQQRERLHRRERRRSQPVPPGRRRLSERICNDAQLAAPRRRRARHDATRTASPSRTSRPCCRSSTSSSASTSACPRCADGRRPSKAASTTPSSSASASATPSERGASGYGPSSPLPPATSWTNCAKSRSRRGSSSTSFAC